MDGFQENKHDIESRNLNLPSLPYGKVVGLILVIFWILDILFSIILIQGNLNVGEVFPLIMSLFIATILLTVSHFERSEKRYKEIMKLLFSNELGKNSYKFPDKVDFLNKTEIVLSFKLPTEYRWLIVNSNNMNIGKFRIYGIYDTGSNTENIVDIYKSGKYDDNVLPIGEFNGEVYYYDLFTNVTSTGEPLIYKIGSDKPCAKSLIDLIIKLNK